MLLTKKPPALFATRNTNDQKNLNQNLTTLKNQTQTYSTKLCILYRSVTKKSELNISYFSYLWTNLNSESSFL